MQPHPSRLGRGGEPSRSPFPSAPPPSVPFELAASVPIEGRVGAVHETVISVGADGPFVALALGYGFEQERGVSIPKFVAGGSDKAPGDLTLGELPLDVLVDGLRVGPRYLPVVFETQPSADGVAITGGFSSVPASAQLLNSTPVFERVQPPATLDFFFTLIDTASGRELQDQPAFNVATLGEATGRRPFRLLSAPLRLEPRTTLRLQIIERTEGVKGTLFFVLFGYKLAGNAACPPTFAGALPSAAPVTVDPRVIPFDYVTRVELSGQSGRRHDDELSIDVDAGFFATSVGYGLQVESRDVPLRDVPPDVNLKQIKLRQLPPGALVDGLRLRPGFLRFAIGPDGFLSEHVPVAIAQRLFETLNRPEDVAFRYTLFDGGLGRDLQNQPIGSVAGLGGADGVRPFKRFARPLEFQPRSTLRVTIEEHFGRGQLYLVFHGHKRLGGRAAGGR